MKLTEEELTYLQKLSDTEVGAFLVRYAKRVQDYVFDSRNWGANDNIETAKRVSEIIQDTFINKLLPQKFGKGEIPESEKDDSYE